MAPPDAPTAGLCASCAHVRVQRSDRGTEFLRCAKAETDPRYRKYPPLPVLRCAGHEPSQPQRPA